MTRFPILLVIPVAVFGLLAGLFMAGMLRDDPDALPSTLVGRQAPALTLGPLPPTPALTDADLRAGRPVVVNFWASWCPPCRAEHPLLEELAATGVPVLGINYKDTPDKAAGFLDELGNPYARLGTDPQGRAGLDWGLYGVPETFVIGPDGTVLLRIAGPVTRQNLTDQIAPALARAVSR